VNIYAIIIFVALITEFVLTLVSNFLNLKTLYVDVPVALEGIYRAEDYRKSQEYIRTNTYFRLVTSGFNLLVLLVFWFAGGFN